MNEIILPQLSNTSIQRKVYSQPSLFRLFSKSMVERSKIKGLRRYGMIESAVSAISIEPPGVQFINLETRI